MSVQDLTDYEYASKRLSYDPKTGILIWKDAGPEFFETKNAWAIWNRRFAGTRAGSYHHRSGYRRICLAVGGKKKRIIAEHRIAWLLAYGEWPRGEVDHINGDRSDNRLCNLREVDPASNMKNKATYSNNTTGACGIGWHKKNRKWTAYITADGKRKHLGCYGSIEEAVAARKAAEEKYGFHKNHGR